MYGEIETNGLSIIPGGAKKYHDTVTKEITRKVYWTEPGLKVTRLRMVSDFGFPFWDITYCHGKIGNEYVEVDLPFSQLPRGKGKMLKALINYAKKDHVYAKGLGILDNISTLI
jgi:hypothetical protein